MDIRMLRGRSFNNVLIILVAAALLLLLMTISLFIYYFVQTELSIFSVIGFIGMVIICLPICIYEYLYGNDRTSKYIFLSIAINLTALTLSGVFWYIIAENFDLLIAAPIGMLLMALSYLPVIVVLLKIYLEQRVKLTKSVRTLVIYINMVFSLVIMLYIASYLLSGNEKSYDVLIYTFSIIGDMVIVSLSILLILLNVAPRKRYIFSIIFGFNVLSFIGDSLRLLSYVYLRDMSSTSQFFYDIMLIFMTAMLIIYILSSIKPQTFEEVIKQLEESTIVIDDLIAQSPDSVCMCDTNGNILKANDRFYRSFNIKKINTPANLNIFNNIFNLDDQIVEQFARVRNGKDVHLDNVRYETQEQGVQYYSIKLYPTYSKENKVINYMFDAEDITSKKNAEDALKIAYDRMEQRVKERTAELQIVNETLQKEIADHKIDEEKIKASLKEKEVLLKEVHHRVKNNMQIISSMLGLQSMSVKDPQYSDMLKDSQNRIRSMALIHEKLYQSENMAQVDFREYVDSLISSISSTYRHNTNITIRKDVNNINFNIDTAIPLGLIINELVSNAIKHAFPDNRVGEIFLQIIDKGNNQYQLIVQDNGIGLTPGFNIANSKSLGLKLVEALIDQLEGTLEVNSNNNCTNFVISFNRK